MVLFLLPLRPLTIDDINACNVSNECLEFRIINCIILYCEDLLSSD
jgi:hypothetical protein